MPREGIEAGPRLLRRRDCRGEAGERATLAAMPGRVRFVLIGLSLALVIALAWTPSASTPGRRSCADRRARERGQRRQHRRGAWPRHHRRPVTVLVLSPALRLRGIPDVAPTDRPGDRPVEDGVLGSWDTAPLLPGEYLLQLTVYDTSGATTTAQVVVNVLPAPTPTPRTQPAFIVPVPGQTPEASEEETGPPPTPLPELPQLDPQIPYIEVPPQEQGQPAIQQVNPPPPGPGFQPINIDQGPRPQQAPLAPLPGPQQPGAAPQFEPVSPSRQGRRRSIRSTRSDRRQRQSSRRTRRRRRCRSPHADTVRAPTVTPVPGAHPGDTFGNPLACTHPCPYRVRQRAGPLALRTRPQKCCTGRCPGKGPHPRPPPLRGANIGCADPLRGANIGCADVPTVGAGRPVGTSLAAPCSPSAHRERGGG